MSSEAYVIIKQNEYLKKFRNAGATEPSKARPLADLKIKPDRIFRKMEDKAIFLPGRNPETYYMDQRAAEEDEGKDALFGDLGNDTMNGGAGSDHMYGGSGDDKMDGGTEADILYGGDGYDNLVADIEGDRLIDWIGPNNTFVHPKGGYGRPTVIVSPSPWVRQFLLDLAASDGAMNPNDEIVVVVPGEKDK